MKRLLFVIVLLVVGVVGLGFYLGWFGIASESADGKRHITLTVDTKKIDEAEGTALKKVHDLGQPGKDPAVAPAQPPQN